MSTVEHQVVAPFSKCNINFYFTIRVVVFRKKNARKLRSGCWLSQWIKRLVCASPLSQKSTDCCFDSFYFVMEGVTFHLV